MKYCRECNIDIDTNRVTCPFCRDILDEKNNDKTKMEKYESYKETPYKNHMVRKIFIFKIKPVKCFLFSGEKKRLI